MAFLSNPVITIDGEDYTGYCTSITITSEKEALEDTVFGMTAREFQAGLENNSAEITLFMDYTALGAWTLLNALYGTKFIVIAKPFDAAVSATNPELVLTNTYMASLDQISASLGELQVHHDVYARRRVHYRHLIIFGLPWPDERKLYEAQIEISTRRQRRILVDESLVYC
jgi:hypothetical protein